MKISFKHFQFIRFMRYACLAIVPLIVLVVLIAMQSRQWASNILTQNTEDLLDKNVSLIDQDFSQLLVDVYQLDSDENLHRLFATADYSDANILTISRDISDICNQYFFQLPSALSVTFYTPEYSFPYYDKMDIPRHNDYQFEYYQQLLDSNGYVQWFPTYNLIDKMNLAGYAGSKKEEYQVFSIGKLMNLTYYRYDVPYQFPKTAQKPVMFINFSPLYFKTMLSRDFLIADTNYIVYDDYGNMIYSSLDQLPISIEELSKQSKTSVEMQGSDHAWYLVCKRKLGNGSDWSVAAIAPFNAAYSYFGESLLVMSVIVLLSTTLYCVFMVFLSMRSFTKPFSILTHAIGHTAEGDFEYRINTTKHRDFRPIFEEYNNMNDHVSQLIRENYEIKLNEKNLEIQVINLQFNPHFLYNTLNIISLMTMSRGDDDISEMICSLSYMMRYSIKVPQGIVPFSKDLQYIHSYIALMKLRFDRPFHYEEIIDDELRNLSVPKFLLQPFIENAILHGFTNRSKQYTLTIRGKIAADRICFTIKDNGEGMAESEVQQIWLVESDSLGIKNTHSRIQLYYGSECGINISSQVGIGTTVTLTLPYKGSGIDSENLAKN